MGWLDMTCLFENLQCKGDGIDDRWPYKQSVKETINALKTPHYQLNVA